MEDEIHSLPKIREAWNGIIADLPGCCQDTVTAYLFADQGPTEQDVTLQCAKCGYTVEYHEPRADLPMWRVQGNGRKYRL